MSKVTAQVGFDDGEWVVGVVHNGDGVRIACTSEDAAEWVAADLDGMPVEVFQSLYGEAWRRSHPLLPLLWEAPHDR